ncbi:hypothetical protein [Bradyrhizobium pachyrhizi]|uniref:hypothetical protein n=1 Tax=Bradyrhizobium pachyrhizi TaxID=280333 RepID=UPI0009E69630|nr:hypothetical protein [Bradyrhizobium pachyrhizi]
MLAESERWWQLPVAPNGRELPICAVIRPILQRGGNSRPTRIDGSRIVVSLGACPFCKLSSGALEGIQARIVDKLGEFVRLIAVATAAQDLRLSGGSSADLS